MTKMPFCRIRALKKIGELFALLLIGAASSAAEQMRTLDTADWTVVLSGHALCPPEASSYGFAVLTDGRMISACTHTGKKLWEQSVKGKPEPYLTLFAEDFLLVVSGKSALSLVNPSGLVLWTRDAGFAITEKPCIGHDGRIFVRGKRNAACYGINGIQKWTLPLSEQGAIPLTLLNDGSLLAFLEDVTSDGKAQALWISPYGEILAALTFSSAVTAAKSVSEGAVLVFAGGGLALCAAENGHSIIKWSIPADDERFSGADAEKGAEIFALEDKSAAAILFLDGLSRVIVFDTRTGAVLSAFDTDIEASTLTCVKAANGGEALFAADTKNARLFDRNGTVLWSAALPPQSKKSGWDFVAYDAGYFILCRKSWTLTGYKTFQKEERTFVDAVSGGKTQCKGAVLYAAGLGESLLFDLMDSLGEEYTGRTRRAWLLKGGYGKEEAAVERALFSACAAYLQNAAETSRTRKKTVFDKDAAGFDAVIAQLPLMGTTSFSPLIAQLLKRDTANVHINALLQAAALSSRSLSAAADCIYEICRFMGRSALLGRGLVMLQAMMAPPYDASVRAYARKTAAKLAELKL